MQSYPVEFLQRMLETYSPSGSEAEVAQLIHNEMRAHKIVSRIDRAGNVLGTLGNEGPSILLCGHMDTVPGRIPVRRDGDFLYGRGAVDAKAALAAMIYGAIAAKQGSAFPIQITVAGVVEEETSSKGIKEIINEGSHYDLAVFGEPSGVSNIIIGYKGSLRLHLTFLTAGGHSAAPWLSASSYDASSAFWSEFQRQFLQNEAQSKFDVATGCVTNIISDGPGNSVPAKTTLDVDIRIPPHIKPQELAKKVEDFSTIFARNRKDVRVQLRIDDETEAFLGSTDSYPLAAFRWAIRKLQGTPVVFLRKTGTGDINVYAVNQRIPMFTYGPGDSKLDHTENERVSIPDYLASIEVYANALPRIAERFNQAEMQPAIK